MLIQFDPRVTKGDINQFILSGILHNWRDGKYTEYIYIYIYIYIYVSQLLCNLGTRTLNKQSQQLEWIKRLVLIENPIVNTSLALLLNYSQLIWPQIKKNTN